MGGIEHRVRRRSSRGRHDSITISYKARDFLLSQDEDASLRAGSANAVGTCLGLRAGQKLLLLCDRSLANIAAAMLREAERVGASVTAFVMDESQADNEAFRLRLAAHLAENDASILVATVGSFPPEFRRSLLPKNGERRRHAHMVGVTDKVMRQSMRVDYREVSTLGRRLFEHLQTAKTMEITTAVGSYLIVELDQNNRWHHEGGVLDDGGWTNLPAGEVLTTPATVSGLLIPDGGIWLPDGSELVGSRAVRARLELSEGQLVGCSGMSEDTEARLSALVGGTSNGRRVGQIGFGTNTGILTMIGSLLQDLKAPGFHLAFGYTLPDRTGARWSSSLELPVMLRRPDVTVDGRPIMVRGRYARWLR